MAGHDETMTVSAAPEDVGARLDVVLAARAPELSRSRLKGLIRDGRVSSGGATISDPDYRVKPGQTFAIVVPEPQPAAPRGQSIPLNIVYEDASIIVIDKPPGLVVHPAPGNQELTLVNALIAHCGQSLSGIGGERRPGIVHRLDKDTSGLMVIAKTDTAHRRLAAQFEGRTIDRAYTAVVWGRPWPLEGEIEGNIGRSPRDRKRMAVRRRGGKTALTRYRVTKSYGPGEAPVASRLECRLASGRTHQIRVHLAHAGHPVIGDPVYGGRRRGSNVPPAVAGAAAAIGRQALHAHLIGFDHPSSGERLVFRSDLSEDIKMLIRSLESV